MRNQTKQQTRELSKKRPPKTVDSQLDGEADNHDPKCKRNQTERNMSETGFCLKLNIKN